MKMKKSTSAWSLAALVAAMSAMTPIAPVASATTNVQAAWEMNEASGAGTMVDSSGHNIDGVIGWAVKTGVKFTWNTTGYRWSDVKPNALPPKPERLIQIDNGAVNPGDRDYAVTFRYKTTRPFGNIMQKGQARTRGGNWKIQLPNGKITCLFRGSVQQRAVTSLGAYNDDKWHVVRCERTAAGVTLTVDGAERRFIKGWTGSISNSVPMTIGGKINCDQIEVTCDYFAGDIDWVRVETS
jgi:hypothetical protein